MSYDSSRDIDVFEKEKTSALRLSETISSNISQKQRNSKQGDANAQLDNSLRGDLRRLEQMIKNLIETIKEWESDPQSFSMTPKEVERRRNQVSDLKNKYQDLESRAFPEKNKRDQLMGDYKKKTYEETETTKNMNNKELYQTSHEKLKKQDEHIDTLIGVVNNIKGIGQDMGKELDEQNQLLDDVDKNIDKNIIHIQKSSNRLTKVMELSSNCCLFTIIAIEIAVLVLILVLL